MTRTENQIAAIQTMAKTLCVDAGAGSGKTSVLVDRILHLIDTRRASLDQIVAITFTDKAAAEMKMRLRKAFRDKAPNDPEEMNYWRDMERRAETARVSTFHSFCAGLLRENALRTGLDPDFAVLTDAESVLLLEDVVTETIHAALEIGETCAVRAATDLGTTRLMALMRSLLRKRSLVRRAGEQHPLRDAEALLDHWARLTARLRLEQLVNLAEGSDVREFRDRLAAFAGQCSDPHHPREVVRREMIALLDQIIGPGRQALSLHDEKPIIEALAALAEFDFRKGGGKKAVWSSEELLKDLTDVEKAVRDFANKARPEDADPEIERASARLTVDVFACFERVDAAYREAKAARTCLDFDDLISAAFALLRENEEVLNRTARTIEFLLIDEFQDTDSMQLGIARLLADHADGPDLFIVGDAKQSIYDFRGAEVEVFQQEKAGADRVISLATNFRTVPEVLDFVNDVFSATGLLHGVERIYAPLETHRAPAGECRVEFLIPHEIRNGDPNPAGSSRSAKEDYRREEAALIAWRIAALCRDPGAMVWDKGIDKPRLAGFGDIALLFRSMSSVHLYEEALRRRDIPYNVIAGAGFYERQEILDIRNLLTVVTDPWNEMALLGFLRGPMAALSDDSLARLCPDMGLVAAFQSDSFVGWGRVAQIAGKPNESPGTGHSSSSGIDACPTISREQAERLRDARLLLDDLRAQAELPLPAFLRYVLDRTGYEAICLSQFLGVQKAHNVRKLIDLAEDFARTRPARLSAFVNYLELLAGQEAVREGDATLEPEEAGAVTLMTIHKAKGLEFPIVVVPDLGRDRKGPDSGDLIVDRDLGMACRVTDSHGEPKRPLLYDAIDARHKAKDADEHARILYVAMTRARDWLLLGGAPNPRSGSWLKPLDDLYGVCHSADGSEIRGGKWRAVVRREAPDAGWPDLARPAGDVPNIESIARHAAPVPERASVRRTFSVSAVLDAMTATSDPDLIETHGASRDGQLRGTLVHRMFERWDLRGEPPVADVLAEECPALKLQKDLSVYLVGAAERFRASPLGRRFADAARIQREAPFFVRIEQALLSGTVDAVLDEETIVDYKTGQPRPDLAERYEWQLRLYAAALQRLRGAAPSSAILYYIDTGACHEVDVSPARLDEAWSRAERAIARLRAPDTQA